MKSVFTTQFELKVEDRGDYWAVSSSDLGMTVYGDTEEMAIARFDKAFEFFINVYAGKGIDGPNQLRKYFDAHGVRHTLEEEGTAHPRNSYSMYKESRIGLGAA